MNESNKYITSGLENNLLKAKKKKKRQNIDCKLIMDIHECLEFKKIAAVTNFCMKL